MKNMTNYHKKPFDITQAALIAIAICASLGASSRAHAAAMVFEAEPSNDSILTATLLDHGEMARGNIDPMTDVDWWSLPGNAVGDLIFAYVDTTASAAGDDSFLYVYDNTLVGLIQLDDNDGPGNGSIVAGAEVPVIGDVFFGIVEDGLNAEITPYTLYVSIVDPAAGHAESESNDSIATAEPYAGPFMTGDVTGIDFDFFTFGAEAGDEIVAIVDDNPDNDGTFTDTELVLVDTDGITVLADGDDATTNAGNGVGAVIAPSTGTYFLRISHGGAAGALDTDYRFVILVNGETPACGDGDGDGICDAADNCPAVANPGQEDADFDGTGDACEAGLVDSDGDGIPDAFDNCPATVNPMQQDTDGDGTGDACEGGGGGVCGLGGLPFGPLMLVGMAAAKRRTRRRRA